MKGDFSNIREPRLSERLVLKQQGRVDLDADDNLAARTADALLRDGLTETIGPAGVPRTDPGFAITTSGTSVVIGAGKMFVDGIVCTLDADTPYASQPDFPGAPPLADLRGDPWLFYLDVWERHVAPVSDPSLLDAALSGLDTTTRARTVWQVRAMGATASPDGGWSMPPSLGGGRLTLTLAPATTSTDPCGPMAAGGFSGLENRLYRIEVHHPGDRPGTTAAEGATAHAAHVVSHGGTTATIRVTGGRLKGPWLSGQPVEIEQSAVARRGIGFISTVTFSGDDADLALTEVADLPAAASVSVYRIASFKWSRDNGSIAYGVTGYLPAGAGSATLTVASWGRDELSSLHEGDVVELIDRDRELRGEPGILGKVQTGGLKKADRQVVIEGDFRGPPALHGVPTAAGTERPRLVRWDQDGTIRAAIPAAAAAIALEQGLSITLGGNGFRTGDYWTFAIRPAEHGLAPGQPARALLSNAPPQGIVHHFAPLATVAGAGGAVTDLRKPFPALTAIHARDVAFTSEGDCSLPSTTVEEALLALCDQNNLTFHNQQLHGWGVVNGLQVHCLSLGETPDVPPGSTHIPRAGECVAIETGYAISPAGRDIRIRDRFTVDLRALLLKAELINVRGEQPLPDKEIRLYLQRDGKIGVQAYLPPPKGAIFEGTIWQDFIDDCLKPVVDFFKSELTETSTDFVTPAQKRLIALLNLFSQMIDEDARHVFLSGLTDPDKYPKGDDREDKILRDLFNGLRALLQSRTFCAMFEDVNYPDLDYIDDRQARKEGRPETVFVKGFHGRRIRTNRAGDRVYTLGNGDTLHEVTVNDRKMTAELKFPVGGAAIQDIAFGPNDLVMYVVAHIGDSRQDTALAVATRGLDGKYTFQPAVSTICDLQMVTIAAPAALTNEILGVAKGQGLYRISLDTPERPTRLAQAYAIGHLALDERAGHEDAYFTALVAPAIPAGSSTYNTVFRVNFRGGTPQSYSVPTGSDDLAFSAAASAILTVGDPVVDAPNKALCVTSLGADGQTTSLDLGADTDVRLAVKPESPLVFFTLEDTHEVRVAELRRAPSSLTGKKELTATLSPARHPVQLDPTAIAITPNGRTLAVLNWLSNTVTLTPAQATSVVDRDKLALYRVHAINAFLGLVGRFLQYLKDCFCEHFLVEAPEDHGQKIYLASVRIKDGQVYRICNFDRRKYVHSFPTVEYWMSLVPVLPILRLAVEKFCCAILPPAFAGLRLPDPEPEAPDPAKPKEPSGKIDFGRRFKASGLRKSYDHVYALNPRRKATSAYTTVLGKAGDVRKLFGEKIARPPVIDPPPPEALRPQKVLEGLPQEAAAEKAKEQGWNVDRVRKVEDYKDPSFAKKLAGPERLERGGVVDVFVDDAGVVRYVQPVPTAEAESRRVDAELRSTRESAAKVEMALGAIQPAESQVVNLKSDLVDLTKRFEEESARSANLASELAAYRSKDAEREHLIGSLQDRLKEMETTNASLRLKVAEVDELREKVAEIDQLRQVVADMDQLKLNMANLSRRMGPG